MSLSKRGLGHPDGADGAAELRPSRARGLTGDSRDRQGQTGTGREAGGQKGYGE